MSLAARSAPGRARHVRYRARVVDEQLRIVVVGFDFVEHRGAFPRPMKARVYRHPWQHRRGPVALALQGRPR